MAYTRQLFSQKHSIVDIRLSSKYTFEIKRNELLWSTKWITQILSYFDSFYGLLLFVN